MTGIDARLEGTPPLGDGADVTGRDFTLAQASSPGDHPVGKPFGHRAFGNDSVIYQHRNAAGDYEVYVHSLRLDRKALAFTSDRPVDFDKDAGTSLAPGFMGIPNPFQMKPSPLKAALERTRAALNAEADRADQARAEASGAPMSPTFAGRFVGGVAGAVRTLAQDVTSGVVTQASGPGPNGMVAWPVTKAALEGQRRADEIALSTADLIGKKTDEIVGAVAKRLGVPLDSPEARFGAQAMQVALMIEGGLGLARGAMSLVGDAGGMRLVTANTAAVAPLRTPSAQQLARTLAWVDEMTPDTYAAMPADVKGALRQGLNANKTKPGVAAALDKLNGFADGPGTTATRTAGGALVRTGADPVGASGGAPTGGTVSTLGTRFGQPITQTPKGNGYQLPLGGKPFYQSPTPISLSDLQKPGPARNALEALGPSPQTGGFSMGVDITNAANRLLQGATGGIGLGAGTGPTNSVTIGETFSGQPLGSGLSTRTDRQMTAGGETLTVGADPASMASPASGGLASASPRDELLNAQGRLMDLTQKLGVGTAALDPQAEGRKLTPQGAETMRVALGRYDEARAAWNEARPDGSAPEPEDLHAAALRAALKGYDASVGAEGQTDLGAVLERLTIVQNEKVPKTGNLNEPSTNEIQAARLAPNWLQQLLLDRFGRSGLNPFAHAPNPKVVEFSERIIRLKPDEMNLTNRDAWRAALNTLGTELNDTFPTGPGVPVIRDAYRHVLNHLTALAYHDLRSKSPQEVVARLFGNDRDQLASNLMRAPMDEHYAIAIWLNLDFGFPGNLSPAIIQDVLGVLRLDPAWTSEQQEKILRSVDRILAREPIDNWDAISSVEKQQLMDRIAVILSDEFQWPLKIRTYVPQPGDTRFGYADGRNIFMTQDSLNESAQTVMKSIIHELTHLLEKDPRTGLHRKPSSRPAEIDGPAAVHFLNALTYLDPIDVNVPQRDYEMQVMERMAFGDEALVEPNWLQRLLVGPGKLGLSHFGVEEQSGNGLGDYVSPQ